MFSNLVLKCIESIHLSDLGILGEATPSYWPPFVGGSSMEWKTGDLIWLNRATYDIGSKFSQKQVWKNGSSRKDWGLKTNKKLTLGEQGVEFEGANLDDEC